MFFLQLSHLVELQLVSALELLESNLPKKCRWNQQMNTDDKRSGHNAGKELFYLRIFLNLFICVICGYF